jgi:SAM-dependent methyltransferase
VSAEDIPSDELIAFYTADYDESARLAASYNALELVRIREILLRRLPEPPADVLDIGGGTGAHAAWLAENGYDVELIDLVPAHVERARELSTQLGRGFDARVGDARSLDNQDAGYDVTLLLGPLYHLQDAPDRAAAFGEAVRVTKPGGLVAAAAISRYAWPLYELRDGADLTDERAAQIAATIETGLGDPRGGLSRAYSHRPAELVEEAAAAGLIDIQLLGIEGPGWILLGEARNEANPERVVANAAAAARLLEGEREVTGASAHLLAIGRRPA